MVLLAEFRMLKDYLKKWNLVPDGRPIITHSSHLLPVRRGGSSAMLKIAHAEEEKLGGELMVWWDGQGAARVLAHEGAALLLERARGQQLLSSFARTGHDAEATRILCGSIAELHRPRDAPLPPLVPLSRWFGDLFPAAQVHGGVLLSCAATARELLDNPQPEGVLHGDIHHDNVLDFGELGWLAIDPKGLWGERGFDYANIFCNPDAATATNRDLFLRRLEIVTETAELDRKRLLQWILAWSGLSAAWHLGAGEPGELALAVASIAAEELVRVSTF